MWQPKIMLAISLAFCLACGAVSMAAEKESGLVLHYDFNEGSGLVAKDKSGNGLDGKIIGAKYVRKDKGYALEFDGKSCVQVAKSKLLNKLGKPGQSYSIEFRFKSTGGREQSLTEKWPKSSVPYPWAIRGPYPDGAVRFAVYDAKRNKGGQASYTHPATKDNKWHHLAAVRDMESGYLLLYIDGVLGRKGRDALTKTYLSNDGQVCIGARNYPYYGITGQLDDVRIYDRALTADEVKSHCGVGGLPVHRDIQSADIIEKYKPVKPAVTLRAGEMTVKAGGRGAVQIDAGSDSYIVESCFSYPGADNKIGWNGLPRAFDQPRYPVVEFQKGAESAWKPVVKQVSADTISVEAKGRHYRIQRTIKVRNGKVDFEDRLTNLSATPTGVVVRHGITANSDFLERYNGGLEVAANPTVFLRGPKRSAAMVMNDDFSRRRIRPAFGSSLNHSGVQLLRFALDAGKTYTFSWSVYVMKEGRGSYFDFINRLRKDWNANFTIDGPFIFGALKPEGDDIKFYLVNSAKVFYVNQVLKDPSKLQKYLKWRGTKMLGINPWLDFDPGAMDHVVTRDEYRQIMRKFLPAIRKAAPQVRVLANIETPFKIIYRNKVKDGHKLPIAKIPTGKYNVPTHTLNAKLTLEQVRIIEEGLSEWKDCFIRSADGKLFLEIKCRGGKALEDLGVQVYPEVGNRHYRLKMDEIRFALDELGMDGVYFDMFALGQGGSFRTYGGEWDGLSARVDFHTGRISGQYKDCSLAGVQARVNLMNCVHSKGKIFVANRHSTTCAEQSIPAFRFTETGGAVAAAAKKWQVGTKPPALNYLFFSHLNSPLGLGAYGAGQEPLQWMMKVTIIYLRHAMVFYHYHLPEPPMTEANKGAFDIIKHMFPITPVELGEGFIVGKERILTAVSLDRLWEKDSKPIVLLFDINGRRVDTADRCEVKPENGKWRVTLKLKDWAEVAVVE